MSLPGEAAHEIMAPAIRKEFLKNKDINDFSPREAAVMMLFYPKNNEMYLSLILRPTYNGVHSGQIALPGGKVEEEDQSFLETALRETEEEIGIKQSNITVVKDFTPVYIPPSNFRVYPFLGYLDTTPEFELQEEEVADIIEVLAKDILDDSSVISEKLSTSYASNIEVPAFELNGYTVWGATAMMLSELKVFMESLKVT